MGVLSTTELAQRGFSFPFKDVTVRGEYNVCGLLLRHDRAVTASLSGSLPSNAVEIKKPMSLASRDS